MVHAKSFQSCPALCDPMDYSPPGSPVHGILQMRTLEWVAMPSSKESSRPKHHMCFGNEGLCLRKSFWFPLWEEETRARGRVDMVRLARRLFKRNMMEAGGGMMTAELEKRVWFPEFFFWRQTWQKLGIDEMWGMKWRKELRKTIWFLAQLIGCIKIIFITINHHQYHPHQPLLSRSACQALR